MNEQFKGLKEQCWVEKHWDKENERWIDRHVDLEKFAELIVRECASLTLDYKSQDHYTGWLDYREEIKKHFEIEL